MTTSSSNFGKAEAEESQQRVHNVRSQGCFHIVMIQDGGQFTGWTVDLKLSLRTRYASFRRSDVGSIGRMVQDRYMDSRSSTQSTAKAWKLGRYGDDSMPQDCEDTER